jgi:hypothetical protein
VAQGSSKDTLVDIGGVSSIGGVVAARELGLVATLGLGLLDRQVVGDREANLGVSLVSDAVSVANTTGRGPDWRQSGHSSSEAEDCGKSELHFEGLSLAERFEKTSENGEFVSKECSGGDADADERDRRCRQLTTLL